MDFEKGAVVQGKVTGITKFGAFVELAPGTTGLVYISEISNVYVKNVADYLSVGQMVTVKILDIDASGRVNLSIKQTLPPPEPKPMVKPRPASGGEVVDASFEDKLKKFMKDSDSKMSDIRRQSERKGSRRRR